MFPDLPEHLQTLNTVSTTPSFGTINTEYEDAVWDYLNTDDLFHNWSSQPSSVQPREDFPPKDLKSFIAQFAHETPIPLPLPYNESASSSTAPTPGSNGVKTADIMPHHHRSSSTWEDSPSEDGRMSGSKKLKQLGAGTAELEEDKRRRNTEASARFRAKKKEREQVTDTRAKELEGQVARLTADKTSLENENKLLKAIVLGGGTSQGQERLQQALAAVGAKRKRG